MLMGEGKGITRGRERSCVNANVKRSVCVGDERVFVAMATGLKQTKTMEKQDQLGESAPMKKRRTTRRCEQVVELFGSHCFGVCFSYNVRTRSCNMIQFFSQLTWSQSNVNVQVIMNNET